MTKHITKHHSQHGAMVALALLGLIDNLSTILTLGRYSVELQDKVLYFGGTNPDDATFLSVINDAITR